jgi:hypothetical protein
MLQGLPFSNELGWWSVHSGNSTSCSSSPGTSCEIPPSGSSRFTTGVSSCDPVWCIRIRENEECTWYENDIWWTWVLAYEWTLLLLFYRVLPPSHWKCRLKSVPPSQTRFPSNTFNRTERVGTNLLFSYYSHNNNTCIHIHKWINQIYLLHI